VVNEDQIADGMAWAAGVHRLVVEGSAALGIAALRTHLGGLAGQRVAVVISGRTVDRETLLAILSR
jgi:threonine dehydratase